jgi:alpha-glucosidase
MSLNHKVIGVLLLYFISLYQAKAVVVSQASSPDNKIKVELLLQNDSIFYQIFYNNQLVISPSNLGLRVTFGMFLNELSFVSSNMNVINESYNLPSGKKKTYQNNCSELTAVFQSRNQNINLVFRLYNDGFAFRYAIPRESGSLDVVQENSEINIVGFQNSWAQEYRKDYSWYYDKRGWTATSSQSGFSAPVLVQSDFTNLLITEAANFGTYAASKIIPGYSNGSFRFQPVGSISTTYPFQSPWRTVIIGSLPEIVASTMIENLNPATDITDLSWIKPGRSAWDWGGEDANNSVGLEVAKRYIDLAHDMGWEYFTLDDGWESSNADYSLSDIVNYATSKSVGVILWSHHNRFTNNYTQISNILAAWKAIGIKGVKVDFWEDDQQVMLKKYDTFMKAASDHNLLVNLHGCTKPSGLRRKWPNLLTSEAVLGGEMYLFNSTMTPAHHNINLTMTRNVIGPMDYTPGDFGTKSGIVRQFSTWSHQLALLTAFESGLQYYIDCPQNYRYHIAESFLKRIPVAWDSIICIEAKPDSFSTIVRKKDDDWFVATLCNNARKLNLSLDFLENGKTYNAYIYKDGNCNSDIKFEYIAGLTKQNALNINMLAKGGATVQLTTSADYPKPLARKYEAESRDNMFSGALSVINMAMCSGGRYIGQIGQKAFLRFQKIDVPETGNYAMTVFYVASEARSSYIKVNGGEPIMHQFNSTGGNSMGFVTILIPLTKGLNTIEFGNELAYSPNIDRIVIKELADPSVISSVQSMVLQNKISVSARDHEVLVDSEVNGQLSIFDLQGRQLAGKKMNIGRNQIEGFKTGIYIVNVNDGVESYSTKVIIK